MALVYTRLLCRRNLDLKSFRCLYTSKCIFICSPTTVCASLPALKPATTACETHDEKNMRLKRPLSPHLTIYQLQLTSMLSVTHRGTGIVLSSYAMILGLGTLFVPGGVPCMVQAIAAWGLPSAVLYLGKAMFVYPLTYHYLNGIRHLAWDLGKFLTIKDVYKTGWTVVGLSAIAALAIAAL
ncbi:succinate dehydrogenase cytochrome b560 subunit, mitochondrial isoform X1 [Nasonia vitripennis]|uniref:Succinate dehydrogenase cytochrome b560 subunit, mitochondrial n=1 Tax=Nasonia vitripennis TaxID=7425 RepID=A0A7M7QNQ1_NASVI|nr:succinate dehydrogenase cytochrome b560 subunit, mitochondrial isoform X1 [Nasonia vitripennis]XP_031789335.1 succinate dehydrogenase cytochrome b560 subunit, mitochondrial isoform X1 [Nasonia vitripennis]